MNSCLKNGTIMLFLLAMDHRDSLAKDVYGIDGEPTPDQVDQISAGKRMVFAGLVEALDRMPDRSAAGVLVDEHYGAAVAADATIRGLTLAMPIERSGQKLFTLEYGPDWMDHVERFDPAHVKVLVRDNPDHDPVERAQQTSALAVVSAALHDAGRSFLFELLVPATDAQLAAAGGDTKRYDTEARPDLTVRVITDMQEAGVEPDLWKIEGLETAAAAERVVSAARDRGRDQVRCIVLGRDAPADRLDHWLSIAAATDGFDGFAIGRSIWEQPLEDHRHGKISESELITRVADTYLQFVEVYTAS
ncbi:MAG TPA: DUF2090 domain-containing protein [Micromonosporaceae bacterium]